MPKQHQLTPFDAEEHNHRLNEIRFQYLKLMSSSLGSEMLGKCSQRSLMTDQSGQMNHIMVQTELSSFLIKQNTKI